MENVEEQCVTPAIAYFRTRFPHHFQAGIYAHFLVENFREAFEWKWILFARRTMNDFRNFDFTGAHIPCHGQWRIDNIIAWNNIDGRRWIAVDGAKQSFIVAGKESQMTAACIAYPTLNWMLICAVYWNGEWIVAIRSIGCDLWCTTIASRHEIDTYRLKVSQ